MGKGVAPPHAAVLGQPCPVLEVARVCWPGRQLQAGTLPHVWTPRLAGHTEQPGGALG